MYDRYVGKPSPIEKPGRNPIAYFDADEDNRQCLCGCGTELAGTNRDFAPGHDQKAVHERVAKVGSVAEFLEWFDKTWEPAF